MDVPAGPVRQGEAADAHILAVAQVDQPAPHPPRNGVLVFTGPDQIGHGGPFLLEALPLRLDGTPRQRIAAAPDNPFAVDPYPLAVGPCGVVQMPKVQQALVALHLDALKPAGDTGQVVLRAVGTLQHRTLLQIDLGVPMACQPSGQVDPRREVDHLVGAAVVQSPLQRRPVHGLAVPRRKVRGGSHIQTSFGLRGGKPHLPHRLHLYPIVGAGDEVLQGHMGAADGAAGPAVQPYFIQGWGLGRQLPPKGGTVWRSE